MYRFSHQSSIHTYYFSTTSMSHKKMSYTLSQYCYQSHIDSKRHCYIASLVNSSRYLYIRHVSKHRKEIFFLMRHTSLVTLGQLDFK